MKYSLATITALGLLGSMTVPANANNTAVESALAGQGDVSMFYRALLNTGVARELNEHTEYTVFAPTNAAFAAIQPREYPCFYAPSCRQQVAAILRNHIVPRNESVERFSKWGGDIPTIGKSTLYVEEPYQGQYTVEGHGVLYQTKSSEDLRKQGEDASLYQIDGVIASDQDLAAFRMQPVASIPGTVTRKTVTTYRTSAGAPVVSRGYEVPGWYAAAPVVYVTPDEISDDGTEMTTVTHTTTTESQ